MWEGFEIFQTRRRNFLSRPSCGQEAWSRDVRGNCANIRAAKKISIVFFLQYELCAERNEKCLASLTNMLVGGA